MRMTRWSVNFPRTPADGPIRVEQTFVADQACGWVEAYLDVTLMPWQRLLLDALLPLTAIADMDPDVWGDQA